jgi:hypothetical protein
VKKPDVKCVSISIGGKYDIYVSDYVNGVEIIARTKWKPGFKVRISEDSGIYERFDVDISNGIPRVKKVSDKKFFGARK